MPKTNNRTRILVQSMQKPPLANEATPKRLAHKSRLSSAISASECRSTSRRTNVVSKQHSSSRHQAGLPQEFKVLDREVVQLVQRRIQTRDALDALLDMSLRAVLGGYMPPAAGYTIAALAFVMEKSFTQREVEEALKTQSAITRFALPRRQIEYARA